MKEAHEMWLPHQKKLPIKTALPTEMHVALSGRVLPHHIVSAIRLRLPCNMKLPQYLLIEAVLIVRAAYIN